MTIKPADKGGAIVIMDTTQYCAEGHRQLADTQVYKILSGNPRIAFEKKVKTIIENAFEKGIIEQGLKQFLIVNNPMTPVLYLLPKIHKILYVKSTWAPYCILLQFYL